MMGPIRCIPTETLIASVRRQTVKRRTLWGIFLAFAILAAARPAHSQVLYGSIVGNVKDPSGAALAGAQVTLTSVETRQSREATTSDEGAYNFATIPTGRYELKIAKPGFGTATESGVMVAANDI